ncbi:fungal-specific transcription factor domain-containing protein [Xylariales sp. PMI_506]|nr:fungal-specific transcription factor domain-containing protein [Xylariales sp. PMI_506]
MAVAARFKPPVSHRTNSLGWAKSDCHTCQSAQRICDRRRPRCDACTAKGVTCGGYIQELHWQDQTQKIRSGGTTLKTLANRPGAHEDSVKTVELIFMQEDGIKKRKKRKRVHQPTEVEWQVELVDTFASRTPISQPLWEKQQQHISSHVLHAPQPQYFQLSSSTLEQLAFFTWTFSPVTLTYNIKANPWQACIPQIDHAPFILHAIKALAMRHRSHLEEAPESISVLEHKTKALSSFCQSVCAVPLEVGISGSLMLIGIDYAESAFGNWIVHLKGAFRMIEAAGGIQVGDNDVHLRAQIAQLVWYDTIIALLSRRVHVFPRYYAECVVSWKTEAQWSLLALNGFPDSAFLAMYDVAAAAADASSLSEEQVAEIEMKLWLASFETQQDATDTEISSLMDCWRLGLLLYCTRVFHRGESVKRKARLLAEEIMWLVHEFPPNSDKQKQALLPLFLAASELESFRFRRIATAFCEKWKRKSGLWLNQTALELLRTVWNAVDANPEYDHWWGEFVNPSPDFGYLFG